MVPRRHGTVTNREEIKASESTQTALSRKIYSASIQKGTYFVTAITPSTVKTRMPRSTTITTLTRKFLRIIKTRFFKLRFSRTRFLISLR